MAASSDREHLQQLFVAIKAVIRKIPRGSVATYGQIAELAGIPGGARIAAAALKTSQPRDQLPWQRVIGKAGPNRGRIAIQDPVGAAVQRQLLDKEGVEIGDSGLVALDRYGWLPGDGSRRRSATAGSGRGALIERGPSRPLSAGKAGGFTPPRVAPRGPGSPVRVALERAASAGSPVRVAPGRTGAATAGSGRGASPRRRPRSASRTPASSSRR
jgi:methylated-DNA-protein-cysteine methyltransferase-like protein